jgi:hypothetical protein
MKEKQFVAIATEIGELVSERNINYGDSFKNSGEILKFLFPNGIPQDKYTVCLALVRILDKIFRLATNPTYNNENCWKDIAGYCILMLGYDQEKLSSLDNVDNSSDKVTKCGYKE